MQTEYDWLVNKTLRHFCKKTCREGSLGFEFAKAVVTSSGDRPSAFEWDFFPLLLEVDGAVVLCRCSWCQRAEVMRRHHGGPVPQLPDHWEEKSREFCSEMLHSNRCQWESRGLQHYFQWWAAWGITSSQTYSHFYVLCIPCKLSMCTWTGVCSIRD